MPASQRERPARRKRLGAWYTPPPLVAAVVDALDLSRVAGTGRGGAVRVLDPACGDGRFLEAVRDVLAAAGRSCELTGVDIDPNAAVHPTVHSTGAADWVCADALAMSWEGATFDVVVGNPPFLNQMAATTSRGGSSQWGGGPYANAAAEFLSLAAQVTRPGGRIGLVLPQSLLSARDAGAVRDRIDETAVLRWAWWAAENVFDAEVRTWAGVWVRSADPRRRQGAVRRQRGAAFATACTVRPPSGPSADRTRHRSASWSWLIADGPAPPVYGGDTLGSIATFGSDFRDRYYGLVPAVGDDHDGPPLVTSGLIDPGRCWWGERPVRFAKRTFAAPRVALERLSPAMQQWAHRRLVPKILVANQTSVIEAVHDRDGAWLPGVPVITCRTDHPDRVMEVLARPASTAWVRYHAAGSGLGPRAVRLTPALLASIPLHAVDDVDEGVPVTAPRAPAPSSSPSAST